MNEFIRSTMLFTPVFTIDFRVRARTGGRAGIDAERIPSLLPPPFFSRLERLLFFGRICFV